jgi:acetyl-CoA C-acetyltransferase
MISSGGDDVVIVSATRTPFSKFGGALRLMHSTELSTIVMKESLSRINVDGSELDELYYGMCIQSEAALLYNINARQAIFHAGLPPSLVSLTIDRACCSSMAAVHLARKSILLKEAKACMAVGSENMSNTPVVLNGHRWGTRLNKPTMVDHLNPIMYVGFNAIARDAGEGSIKHNVSRQMQDEWAFGSQQKYQAAKRAGKFKLGEELTSVEIPKEKGGPMVFEEDEFPKPDTTYEKLAKLKPVYESPTATAGNAPGLDAGASAMVIMTRAKAERLGLKPMAVIVSVGSVAALPIELVEVPARSIYQAMRRANLTIDDISIIEINEAFAAVTVVSTKLLANGDDFKWRSVMEKTNVNGGAIAIGHPVGASGLRILMTAMYELRRRGGGYAAAAICGGLSQGDAAIIKVDDTCI